MFTNTSNRIIKLAIKILNIIVEADGSSVVCLIL